MGEHRSQEFDFKKAGRAFHHMCIHFIFILKEVSYLEKLYVPYLFEFSMRHFESKWERKAPRFPISYSYSLSLKFNGVARLLILCQSLHSKGLLNSKQEGVLSTN